MQDTGTCCKVYGNASAVHFAPAAGPRGTAFAKRRGPLPDDSPPSGMACAPAKGNANHTWSNEQWLCTYSSEWAGAGMAPGYRCTAPPCLLGVCQAPAC